MKHLAFCPIRLLSRHSDSDGVVTHLNPIRDVEFELSSSYIFVILFELPICIRHSSQT